ncbi:hypothetical protein ALC57_13727 [Trachymyrmex cornetzi]|uniref:Uncharacterized protein n=1 Tax=Trachymyrmex cornetzi TaxID=471704 RepID=A0A195DMT6_9HYME|nr:hypothetical protein ALC57_13727 [Trachymyrmex cornetzi]
MSPIYGYGSGVCRALPSIHPPYLAYLCLSFSSFPLVKILFPIQMYPSTLKIMINMLQQLIFNHYQNLSKTLSIRRLVPVD